MGAKRKGMNTNQVVDLLLNKELEISSKMHNVVTELLRVDYETERGREEVTRTLDSIRYTLDEIERVLNR